MHIKKSYLIIGILALWGFIAAIILVGPHWPLSDFEIDLIENGRMYMRSRWKRASTSIAAFNSGVFPDITDYTDHSLGLFFWGGLIGHIMGIEKGYDLLAFLSTSATFSLYLVFPIEIYYIFKSKVLAFCSPFIIHVFMGKMLYIEKTDVHWASAWSFAIILPLLYELFKRKWDKISWSLLALISLLISITNIARSQFALGPTLILLFVVLYKFLISDTGSIRAGFNSLKAELKTSRNVFVRRIFTLTLSLGLIFISYGFLSDYLPNKISEMNAHDRAYKVSTIWHNIYIGFGFEKNPYGIRYDDDCAHDLVKQLYGIDYPSEEYFYACKDLVFDMFKNDPWFCIKGFIQKFILSLMVIAQYFIDNRWMYILIFIILCMIIWPATRRDFLKEIVRYKFLLISCLAGTLIGLVQPVLAQPDFRYAFPAIGAMGVLQIILALICIKVIIQKLRRFNMSS